MDEDTFLTHIANIYNAVNSGAVNASTSIWEDLENAVVNFFGQPNKDFSTFPEKIDSLTPISPQELKNLILVYYK